MFEKNFKKASICFKHTSSTNPLTCLCLLVIYRLHMFNENFKTEASICSRYSSSANRFTFFISFQGVGEVVSVGDSVPADLKGKFVGYIWNGAFAEYIVRHYEMLIH